MPRPRKPKKMSISKKRAQRTRFVQVKAPVRAPVAMKKKSKSKSRTLSRTVYKAAKKALPHVGQAIGAMVGGPAGALVSHGLSAGLGKIFGNGAYRISSNSILHGSQIPEFRDRRGRHETRVRHRGFIADISGTSAFTNTSYSINPGNPALFPWLSVLASQFEEYRVHGLVFEYRSTAANSVGTTNTSMGSVVMATEYNSTLASYINKLQMENAEFSASCVAYDSMLHPIECKRSETVIGELYVRNSPLPSGQDQRLYDMGNFQIATVGQQGTNKIGELWYSIDLSLYKERYGQSSGTSISTAHYTATTGITTSAYFGTSQTQVSGTNFALSLGTTTITFPSNMPVGNYMLNYTVLGSSTAVTAPTVAFTNCAALSLFNNAGGSLVVNSGATTTYVTLIQYFTISATATGAPVVTFSGGTLPTSPTWMDLIITQINYEVNS